MGTLVDGAATLCNGAPPGWARMGGKLQGLGRAAGPSPPSTVPSPPPPPPHSKAVPVLRVLHKPHPTGTNAGSKPVCQTGSHPRGERAVL